MRRLFRSEGLTRGELRWGEKQGRWRHVSRGVYAEGPTEPTPLDRALAVLVRTGGVASGHLAGVLHELDSVRLRGPDVTVPPGSSNGSGVRRRTLANVVVVEGYPCTDGVQTLVDLAATLDDLEWEQALESALRKRLVTIGELEVLERLPARVRRVLALRPPGAPPTESLLETLMVQLIRTVDGLPDPIRQYWVDRAHARLDLCWPELGLFIELDGQHHAGQPLYDARRETAVVAATGWLCGRFTWTEVVRYPTSTARRLAALADQARRRPVSRS